MSLIARKLSRLFQTTAVANRLLQKKTSAISGPPPRILSTGERAIHIAVMTMAWLIAPLIFFPNLKRIRGIREENHDNQDEEGEDEDN